MEFDEVIRRRRMVRSYDPDRPVPAELVDKLLRHALRAPSAGFAQGWGFLVLQEPADRDRYWSVTTAGGEPGDNATAGGEPGDNATAGGEPGDNATADGEPGPWLQRMRTAPLIIVALSNKAVYLERYAEPDKGWTDRDEARWPVPYWHIDAGFAALLMHLTAVDLGLGSCFIGLPAQRIDAFRAAFAVPEQFTPIGALTAGYPAPDRRSPSLRRGRRSIDEVVRRGRWS